MDTIRDDFARDADPGVDDEQNSHDEFLLTEGLEMLAHYRAISDPQMRLLLRQLVTVIADGQKRKH